MAQPIFPPGLLLPLVVPGVYGPYTLPTLYKRTSTGKIEEWHIAVWGGEGPGVGTISTTYGHTDGKQQTTQDRVTEGKNIGKKNETTPFEQAMVEAKAKWEKQVKKGYVEDRARAEQGETDHTGGIAPMLAHKFSEQGHKIVYPAFAQPKLDGTRCIATVINGKCTLWSRTRKPITSVPHIISALEKRFPGKTLTLDGELYNHALKADFERLISLIRQVVPAEGHEDVEYHIYDYPSAPGDFADRHLELLAQFQQVLAPLVIVPTVSVDDETHLMLVFGSLCDAGYEGCMVRNTKGLYLNKRSYDLQKVKEFDEEEFKIVGITEGRGRMAGKAVFTCVTKDSVNFDVKKDGSVEKLAEYFQNAEKLLGKMLTVQFQGYTNTNKVPRFPIGKVIRDYE